MSIDMPAKPAPATELEPGTETAPAAESDPAPTAVTGSDREFEIGVHDPVSLVTAVGLGLQHILGLAGLLLFPALLGKSFHLSPGDTAYLYGITFITSGVVVISQSVGLLRLPIVQAPFAGIFAALLVVGHQDGLGTAFGSLVIASAIWCLLSIPHKRWSVVALLAQRISTPLVSGVILLVISTQLGTIVLPGWFGQPGSGPAFPWINLTVAAVSLLVVLVCSATRNRVLRRGAMLWGVIVGALLYTALAPTTWHNVAHATAFNGFRWAPFGFGVQPLAVVIFFIAWFPAISESIATYNVVADWTGEPLPPQRIAKGVFGEVVGSTLGAMLGGMSAMAYPGNVGLLKMTRVASRWVTLTTGLILVVLGGFGYFDALLVAIPAPALDGATTVLFALIFAGGLEQLSRVAWTQAHMLAVGVPFIMAMGLLFTPASVQAGLPSWLNLIIGQPLVVSVVGALIGLGIMDAQRWRRPAGVGRGPSS